MQNEPKITVIVPIYKVETYLVQCLDSIRDQTLKDIEVLLVDEGDRDVCYAIMKLYAEDDPRFKIIHQKCGGYGAACNLAIDAARGEYIGIVESDDFIEPTMYEEMYARAKELDADVLKTPFYYYWDAAKGAPERKKMCDYRPLIKKTSPDGAFQITDHPQQMAVHASVWSGLYKTAFMKENDIRFVSAKGAGYVDVEFRIRTLCEAKRLAWLDRAFYNYRCTNLASSTNTFNLTAMLQRWKEAHDYFDARGHELYKAVGPYLFLDEYLNTFAYLFIRPVTDEHYAKMRENLARIDDSIIKNAYGLNAVQKKRVLALRRYETKGAFLRHATRPRLLRILSHLLRFDIQLRPNQLKFHFCSGLSRPVSSFIISCFGLFSIRLIFGKE